MRARRTCGARIETEDGLRRNCPALATGPDNLCDEHRVEREARRGTTTERGYGSAHARTRQILLARLTRTPPQDRICALCGDMMLRSEPLDLDHTVRRVDDPSSRGDRLVHADCNNRRSKAPTLNPRFEP